MAGNVDAEALKTFLAVHRLRSFSKAAQTLHRTQPAISRRVGQLEDALGATLFERGATPLVLSQAGRVLVPYAERALAAIQDAEHAVRNLNVANTGPVSMAVVGTLAGRDLSAALRRFAGRLQADAPNRESESLDDIPTYESICAPRAAPKSVCSCSAAKRRSDCATTTIDPPISNRRCSVPSHCSLRARRIIRSPAARSRR